MNIFTKILNNATLMSWSSYVVRFGSFFLVLPLLIKFFSQEELSIYLFLQNSLIGFALLADSGFGSVLLRGVSYFKAGANYLPRTKEEFDNDVEVKSGKPNAEMLAKLFSTSNIIYSILIAIIIVLLSTIGIMITWNIMEQADHRVDLWLAFLIVGIYCIILLYNVRWRAICHGLNYIAKESKFGTLLSAVRVLLFILLLPIGAKPYVLFVCFLFEAIIQHMYIRSIVKIWFKDNYVVIKNKWTFDKNIFRSLWAASWKVGGIHWGNFFVERGNSIIVAQIPDPILITSYLLTERFINVITSISRITFYSNIPTIYSLAAKKDYKTLKIRASGYMFLGMTIMFFGLLFLSLFGNSAINYIGKEKQLVPFIILIIWSVTQLLDLHSSCHAGIYQSTNHIPFLWPSLISGIIIVSVGFYIMPIYGLIGIVLTRFLVQFSFNNWYAMSLSLKLLKWPFYKYVYQMPYFGSHFIYERLKFLIKRS